MSPKTDLAGLRVLVVEDQFLIAEALAMDLAGHGCEVVGPTGKLPAAIELARTAALDGALLDVNLNGKLSYPIAAVLRERGLPFIFLTGYDTTAIPAEFAGTPRVSKPMNVRDLMQLVGKTFRGGNGAP